MVNGLKISELPIFNHTFRCYHFYDSIIVDCEKKQTIKIHQYFVQSNYVDIVINQMFDNPWKAKYLKTLILDRIWYLRTLQPKTSKNKIYRQTYKLSKIEWILYKYFRDKEQK